MPKGVPKGKKTGNNVVLWKKRLLAVHSTTSTTYSNVMQNVYAVFPLKKNSRSCVVLLSASECKDHFSSVFSFFGGRQQ